MKLKTYHADAVESAIRLARIELGDEAIFLGSRILAESEAVQGRHEVTFAVLDPEEDGPPAEPAEQAGSEQGAEQGPESPDLEEPQPLPETPVEAAGGDESRRAPRNGSSEDKPAEQSKPAAWKRWLFPRLSGKEEQPWQPRQVSHDDNSPEQLDAAENGRHQVPAGGRSDGTAPGVDDPNSTGHPVEAAGSLNPWPGQIQAPGPAEQQGLRRHWKDYLPAPEVAEEVDDTPAPDTTPTQGAAAAAAARAKAPEAAAPEHPPEGLELKAIEAPLPPQPPQPPGPPVTVAADAVERLSARVEELHELLERQPKPQPALFLPSGKLLADPRLGEIYASLICDGIEPPLAAQLVAGLESAVEHGTDRSRLRARLREQLRQLCQFSSRLGRPGSQPRTVAFVGPSGVGKTTTLAKLAIRYGLVQQHRVSLLTVDQQRIGAVESLQAYADLLGAPLTIVDQTGDLPSALQWLSDADEADRAELVLIDTPGYGPPEWSRARQLAELLEEQRNIDVQLVLSLAAKPPDLRRALERYQIFRPQKLLFTKLDETESHGALLNEVVRTQLPLSYFTAGQRVPEDIAPAGEAYLMRLLLKSDVMS